MFSLKFSLNRGHAWLYYLPQWRVKPSSRHRGEKIAVRASAVGICQLLSIQYLLLLSAVLPRWKIKAVHATETGSNCIDCMACSCSYLLNVWISCSSVVLLGCFFVLFNWYWMFFCLVHLPVLNVSCSSGILHFDFHFDHHTVVSDVTTTFQHGMWYHLYVTVTLLVSYTFGSKECLKQNNDGFQWISPLFTINILELQAT